MWPGFESWRQRDMWGCGLSLFLVLSLAPRGFSAGTPVFPSPQNQHFQILIQPGIGSTKNHYLDILPPDHYYLFIYLEVKSRAVL